jgi:hypothetical protein
MTAKLILILIICGHFGVAHSQEEVLDGSVLDQPSAEETQEKAQDSQQTALPGRDSQSQKEPQKESQKEPQKEQEVSKTKPPKEVFKPTEEISEDLPVPFPVDI